MFGLYLFMYGTLLGVITGIIRLFFYDTGSVIEDILSAGWKVFTVIAIFGTILMFFLPL